MDRARVHIAHHSAADSLFLIREAKRRGVDVTVETCPQYLLLNTDHTDRLGGILRLNPPIREPRHNQPLWDALMDGTIDMIATDHAPHAPEEKTRENIWECDCGFPGIETQMALMLTEVNRERASPDGLRALEFGQPGQSLGHLRQKCVHHPRRRRRHRHCRYAAQRHPLGKPPAAQHQQDLALAWSPGQGLSAAYAGARQICDAQRRAGHRGAGWGRSVKAIQQMPTPRPQNTEHYTNAILSTPEGVRPTAEPRR
ncbi:dihydroorotase family protein [Halopseudomonas pachastrellae]|nr:dihydroorotase family protein [Halopseudomonas pachastrellae]